MLQSPIRWVGGKKLIRKHIVALLPSNHTCYTEVFGGGAWVLFAKAPSEVEVLNDIDQELINFFRVVQHCPEALLKSFRWSLVSRAEFKRLAALNPQDLSEVERAHRFYYLIMAGWGGELKHPRLQTSISDPGGYGNRLIGAMKHLEKKLMPIHKRLSTVIIENLDWQACIDRYDRPKAVLYLDPPYPGNGVGYAHNLKGWDSHVELAARLAKTSCRWILSSYDQPAVRELYAGCHFVPIQFASGMRTTPTNTKRVQNQELLIMNYTPEVL